jgi:polyadenylate-binding protein
MAAAPATTYTSSSLYVGDLNVDVSEAKLFDIFNAVGPVASIRVCRDAMLKRSLGYAYVNFHQQEDAVQARERLNYTNINDRPMRIMWSQRDPALRKSGAGNVFVKSLHKDMHHKELQEAFAGFGNILSCKVAFDSEGKSKGYGYVQFETDEVAQKAIERMNGIEIGGQSIQCAIYQKKAAPMRQTAWTNLFVKNVPTHMTEADLTALFAEYGALTSLKLMTYNDEEAAKDAASAKPHGVKSGASKGFAFVAFAEHAHAEAAAAALNGRELEDPEGSARRAAAVAKAQAEGKEIVEGAASATRPLFVGRAQKKEERMRELKKKFQAIRERNAQSFTGVNLFVKNLDDQIDDKALHEAFSSFGNITSSRVMRNPDGSSKGFGFVAYSTPEQASAANNEMMGKILGNKPIFVALAQRRDQRQEMLAQQHLGRMGQGMPPQGMAMQGGLGPRSGMPQMYGAVPMMYNGPNNFGKGVNPYASNQYNPYAGNGNRNMPRGPPVQMGPGAYGGQRGYPQQPMYQQPAMYPMGANMGPGGPPVQQRRQRNQNQPRGGPMGGQMAMGGGGPMGGKGGRGQQNRGPQQMPGVKFTNNARNQPGQMPMQGMPPPPQQMQEQAPMGMGPVPLTAAMLAAADESAQKNMIGERLYPLISAPQPELAGKITGMLLEMDNSELLHLLEAPDALHGKIDEALDVLKAHQMVA